MRGNRLIIVKYVGGLWRMGVRMADDESDDSGKRRQQPPPIEFLKPGQPQTPPTDQQQAPVAWVTRPEDYQRPTYPAPPAPPRQAGPRGYYGLVAGILLLLAGFIGIAAVISTSITPMTPAQYATISSDPVSYATNQICSIIVVWAQAAAILGGIMAIQRLNWRLTMVCAIFATLTIGFYLEASVIGMAGFILVVMARKEFLS